MTDEQIITALDIEDGTDEVKQHIVEATRHIVEARVIGIVTELMAEDQLADFEQLVAAGDDAAVWNWLRTNVVGADVSEVYEAALVDYIEEFRARPVPTR